VASGGGVDVEGIVGAGSGEVGVGVGVAVDAAPSKRLFRQALSSNKDRAAADTSFFFMAEADDHTSLIDT
jgi:hypothetical protein